MIKIIDVIKYFPKNISNILSKYLETNNMYNSLEEIRLRANKPLILKFSTNEKIFEYIIKTEDILEALEHICQNSIHTYQNQICNGYITVKGGHRVGVTGNAVIESEKVININYISGLNFRIAKQILNSSNKIIPYVLDIQNNTVFNTLIVSAPAAGKTTILRDLVRQISNGVENFNGLNVGLVDERGELAAMFKGVPQNDIGIRTDVLDNIPKAIGMRMLIRSMSPNVIVADEIGNSDDVEAINYAICCGIKGIFTAHGATFEDLALNPTIKQLLNMCIFDKIIFLKNKKVSAIYRLNKRTLKYEIY